MDGWAGGSGVVEEGGWGGGGLITKGQHVMKHVGADDLGVKQNVAWNTAPTHQGGGGEVGRSQGDMGVQLYFTRVECIGHARTYAYMYT